MYRSSYSCMKYWTVFVTIVRKKANRYVGVMKKDVAQTNQSVATFHLVRNSRQTIHSLLQRFPLTTKERQELQQRLERNQYNEGTVDHQVNKSVVFQVSVGLSSNEFCCRGT